MFERSTYSPGFVTQVVDGVQGVQAGNASILQGNDEVAEILILCHAVGVLADEHKVRLE